MVKIALYLYRGKEEILVKNTKTFSKIQPLIKHYTANKGNNTTIIGFFYQGLQLSEVIVIDKNYKLYIRHMRGIYDSKMDH